MKVIFLDIDGVLINRASCIKRFDNPAPECVARLNNLLERTSAKIIVSSCWRIGRTVKELKSLLTGWGVQGEVIDRTPHTGTFSAQRGDEIGSFLRDWKGEPIESFIIVDDDADMGQFLPHLVHTRFVPGLTQNDVEMAVKLLEKLAKNTKDPASQPSLV